MRAVTWHGKHDVRVDTHPDPVIEHERDVIIKVTACAICGSDLHLYDGVMPTMEEGDILGHETMGEVVEVGSAVTNLKKGDRIVTPFNMACGECWFCKRDLFSCCDNSNRNAEMAIKMMGHSPSGLFGYSHMLGGYAGGQAEYLRIPFGDFGHVKVPDGLDDEQVLFLSDILPTGYMGAEHANIQPGDTVAIWGCGPVGQFAIRSAFLMGAERVFAIDEVPERLKMARDAGAETIDFTEDKVYDVLQAATRNRGPDGCIDCVGAEAAGHGSFDAVIDRIKTAAFLATDRIHVIREMVQCCRKGGSLSIPGVYIGYADKFPLGALMNKGLTVKTGQTHTHRYLQPLLDLIVEEKIDTRFLTTDRGSLEDAPDLYKKFYGHTDGCIKCVLRP